MMRAAAVKTFDKRCVSVTRLRGQSLQMIDVLLNECNVPGYQL